MHKVHVASVNLLLKAATQILVMMNTMKENVDEFDLKVPNEFFKIQ